MTNAQLNKQFETNMKRLQVEENVERHLEGMVVNSAMRYHLLPNLARKTKLHKDCFKLEKQRKRIAETCKLLGIDPGFDN